MAASKNYSNDQLVEYCNTLKSALQAKSASNLVSCLKELNEWEPTIEGLRASGLGRVVRLVMRKAEEYSSQPAPDASSATTEQSESTAETSFGLARSLSSSLLANWQTIVEQQTSLSDSSSSPLLSPVPAASPVKPAEAPDVASPSPDTPVKRGRDVESSSPAAKKDAKKPRLPSTSSASASSSSSPSPVPLASEPVEWVDEVPASPSREGIKQELPPADVRLVDKDSKMVEMLANALMTAGPDGQLAGCLNWRRTHAVAVAMKIVSACHRSCERTFAAKMRSLIFNIKSIGNDSLRKRILAQTLSASALLQLESNDLCDPATAEIQKIQLQDAQALHERDETAAESDMFECRRCKQRRVTYYQMQTRSADEPMTVFIRCLACNHRWRE